MQIYLQDPVQNVTALELADPATYQLYRLIVVLKKFYTPCLIAVGCAGNLAVVGALRDTRFKGVSAVPYMAALCATDTVLLLSLLAVWLSHFGFDLYNSEGWCETLTYSTYICGFLSVWLTVCLAVDRAATVLSPPGRVKQYCTPLKAKLTILGFVAVAVTVFLNVSLLYGLIHTQVGNFCIPLPQFAPALSILSNLDMAVNFVLPFSAIAVLLLVTGVRMRQIHVWRKWLIPAGSGSVNGSVRLSRIQREMCLPGCLLSLAVLVLGGPGHVLRLVVTLSDRRRETTFLWQQLCIFFIFTRAALNLPILTVTSRSFRSALFAPAAHLLSRRNQRRAFRNVHQTLAEFSLTALGQTPLIRPTKL